jgi:GT2 family glycosyltransferase
MAEPLVSVVIPTFNRAYCIQQAINSAREQTHERLEIIVVDDGSIDDTRAMVTDLATTDHRIRYAWQENQGVSAARNHALKLAQGDFIAFLDSDDLWMPWKIELQLACLKRVPHAGMIWTEMAAIDKAGRITNSRYLRTMYSAYNWFSLEDLFDESYPLTGIVDAPVDLIAGKRLYTGDIFSQMIVGNLVHTSTALLRRERLERVGTFSEELRQGGEDYEFHLLTCREGTVAFADVPTIGYRVGAEDQITCAAPKIHFARAYLNTISAVIERDSDRITLPEETLDRVLCEAHGWVGEAALNVGEKAEARRHLATSLSYRFWQPRMLAQFLGSYVPKPFERTLRKLYRRVKSRRSNG